MRMFEPQPTRQPGVYSFIYSLKYSLSTPSVSDMVYHGTAGAVPREGGVGRRPELELQVGHAEAFQA